MSPPTTMSILMWSNTKKSPVYSMYPSIAYDPKELSEVYSLDQPYTEASSGPKLSYPNDDGYMSTADCLLLPDEEMYFPRISPSAIYLSDNSWVPVLDVNKIISVPIAPGFNGEASHPNLTFSNPAHEQDSCYPPLSPFSDLSSEMGWTSATNLVTCTPESIEPPSPEPRYSVQAHPLRMAASARKAQTK